MYALPIMSIYAVFMLDFYRFPYLHGEANPFVKELDLSKTLPSSTSIALTAIIPFVFRETHGMLSQFRVSGNLLRIGVVASVYGITM